MNINSIIELWISEGHDELGHEEYNTLVNKMVLLNINTTIYRGLKLNDNQKILPNKKLTSWTYDIKVAENFGDIVLEWKPDKPIFGLDISDINYYEKEIIVLTK
jgi:hypothetical protein